MNKLATISISLLIANTWLVPTMAASSKKDPCLKNNNGIGNNYDIYVELPTNSLTLNDSANEILSIRIDPGNFGQVKKFKSKIAEQGFDTVEINFVVAQLIDAEKKLKVIELKCSTTDPMVDVDYTFFPD